MLWLVVAALNPNKEARIIDLKTSPSCLARLPQILNYNQNLPIVTVPRQVERPPNITRAFIYSGNMGLGAVFAYRLLSSSGWRLYNNDTRPVFFEAYSNAFVNYSVPFSNVTYDDRPAYGQEFLWRVVDQPITPDDETLKSWDYPPIVNLTLSDYNAYNLIRNFEHLHQAFESHFSWKPHFQRKANDFIARTGINNCTTLAVHYRGTDKVYDETWPEAFVTDWNYIFGCILHFLVINPHYDSVFIASDDQRFITQLEQNIGAMVKHVRFISIDDPTRSNGTWVPGGGGVHHSKSTPVDVKLEYAVMNLLVMKQCGYLMKSPSALSAFAKLLHPSLPTVLFNPPLYDWFPDAAILLHPFFHTHHSKGSWSYWIVNVTPYSPTFLSMFAICIIATIYLMKRWRTLEAINRRLQSSQPTFAAIKAKLVDRSRPTFEAIRRKVLMRSNV